MKCARSSRPVKLRVSEGIATLTLSVPGTGNRIDAELAEAFQVACDEIAWDETAKAVLLVAEGDDFCLGGLPLCETGGAFERYRVAAALHALPQPTIAVLQGRVHDQGMELALAADIRLADASSTMAMRQIVNGGFPFDGGTQRLPRIAGPTLAMELMLLGREIDAERAVQTGLANAVFASSDLERRVLEWASSVAHRGAQASRFAKEALRSALELPLSEGMRLEADLSFLLHGTHEREAGLRAFNAHHSARRRTSSEECAGA